MAQEERAFQWCLEELRIESQYIGDRLERVYILQNFTVLLTGGAAAAISLVAAIGRATGVQFYARPFYPLLLLAPWILVPGALMVLRNHFYIDIAERYVAKVLFPKVKRLVEVYGFDPPLPRVHYTRKGILMPKSRLTQLFMSFVALAEYAIPFSMSLAFMIGFWSLVYAAGDSGYPLEYILTGASAGLLLFLVAAVAFGRGKRPHEAAFPLEPTADNKAS